MSVRVRGSSSSNMQEVEAHGAARVTALGPDIGSYGRYRHVARTGAITAIAAVTASAGHLYAFRNATAVSGKLCLIERVRATFQATVLPATAQEFGIALYRTTAHTVQPTSGTAATLTTPQAKLRTSHAVPDATIYFENTTGELTAGTYTLDTMPMAEETAFAMVAGDAVPKPAAVIDLDLTDSPLVLAADQGFIIANAILQANSLACVLRVMTQWREVASYAQ